ncbi:MAG: hypothetical protein ACRC67_30190 [Inquilinus sp.]|uniref:hypothetical protein n=1 Tax=Inquilinus sp. TaxID=1932117 RepID=UPI003F416519
MANVPRGVRNNNPGNIERRDPWQGLAKPGEMTAEQRKETRFAVFSAPEWGVRALARVLIAYQDKHGLFYVSEIIGRWAPGHENNTGAYIQAVLKAMLVRSTDRINVHDYDVMKPLVEAIIAHENAGYCYPAAVIDKGLLLAGIEPPARKVVNRTADKAKTAVAVAGAGAIGGTIIDATAGGLQQLAPAIPVVRELADLPMIALSVLAVVAAAGLVVWLVLRRR